MGAFNKLASKVTKEYEKKGDKAKTAKEIGKKVAGKVKAEREDKLGRRK